MKNEKGRSCYTCGVKSLRELLTPLIFTIATVIPIVFSVYTLIEADYLTRLPRDIIPGLAKHQSRMFNLGCMGLFIGISVLLLRLLIYLDEQRRARVGQA